MKKLAYSLLLFLSVSCSSAATQSAPTPEKKVETASQEKVAQNQSKGFVTHVVQWREDVRWLLIASYLIPLAIQLFPEPKKNFLLKFLGVSLVVTCITAGLSTCLHFVNEEKEVKRLTFTKHFLLKWIPLLQIIAIKWLLCILYSKWKVDSSDKGKEKQKEIIIYSLEIAFVCLIAAPITPYLTSYLKLGSDDTIKPQKTTQKFSFFKRWISYNGSIITYSTIIGIVCVLATLITEEPSKSLLLFIIMTIVTGWNIMIYYTFEKEKMPSEQNTFGLHFFRNTVPILLAFFTLILTEYFSIRYFGAPKNKDEWSSGLKNKCFLMDTILYNLIYGLIIAPILVVIEMYMFEESAQRDSSKKSREEAQGKADII